MVAVGFESGIGRLRVQGAYLRTADHEVLDSHEGPDALDIVELNPAVIDLAPWFPVNQGVLHDRRTRTIVMDGRAWLRRTRERYDVVTLEPMSPHFAGTNALYSERFYQLVAERLNPDGVVAQWLLLHLVPPRDAASIVKTFISVVPRTRLWIDPVDRTGILVGTVTQDEGYRFQDLPGFERGANGRELTEEAIRQGFVLGPSQLVEYARGGTVITDDNLLLAYGSGRRETRGLGHPAAVHRINLDIVERVRAAHPRLW